MATANDLLGLGFPGQHAEVLGYAPHAVTTTGTAQSTAAAIRTKNTVLTTASSQTGAILPADAKVGDLYVVFNPTATSGVVYCPVGDTMNGSSNGSQTVAQNKMAILFQFTEGVWASIVAA